VAATAAPPSCNCRLRKFLSLVLVVSRLTTWYDKKGLKRRSPTVFWQGVEQKGPKMLDHEAEMRADKG